MCLFSPLCLGKMSILTNIFQMGWNHQLGYVRYEINRGWELVYITYEVDWNTTNIEFKAFFVMIVFPFEIFCHGSHCTKWRSNLRSKVSLWGCVVQLVLEPGTKLTDCPCGILYKSNVMPKVYTSALWKRCLDNINVEKNAKPLEAWNIITSYLQCWLSDLVFTTCMIPACRVLWVGR